MSTDPKHIERPVSSNEKLYLSGSVYFSDLVIQAVIEGDGSIPLELLQKAVNEASALFPGARLRLDGSRWIADAPAPKIEVLSAYPDYRGDIDRSITLFHPLDPASGRCLSVSAASHEGRSLFVFRALHAVMDGQGMQIWIKAIFALLRGEKVDWKDSLLTDDQALAELSRGRRENESIRPFAKGPRCENWKSEDALRFSYARASLDGTVPGLLAKLAVAIDRILEQGSGDRSLFMVPVDIRNDLTPTQRSSTANLSLPLLVPLQKGEGWTTVSQRILDALEGKKYLSRGRWDWLYRRLPSALFAGIFRGYWLDSLRRGRYVASAVLSHTGRQDPGDFSTPTFRAEDIAFLPCAIPVAPLSLVISETGQSTELVLTSAKALWSDPRRLLDELMGAAGLAERVRKTSPYQDMLPAPARFEKTLFPDKDLNLHQLVERQVKASPANPALIFEGQTIRYEEMNRRANRLAHLLLERGICRGDFVGLGLERSPDVIISILAIMKAGAAYVPLDPSMPASRLSYMVEDCKARFVITQAAHRGIFESRSELLILDECVSEIARQSDQNPDLDIGPLDLCYMIYTSGSTGMPKGAMNHHAALTNHFLWFARNYPLTDADCTLQKTPISFDASLLEVFLPLQSGGRIIITRPEGHKDARYMLNLMRDHKVTFLSIVPSVFNVFLDEIDSQEQSSLRLVLMGGEEFTRQLYEKFKTKFPGAEAVNLYGPAEAAIDTLTFDCRSGFTGRSVPIGHPISNVECYVVDERMRLLPAGRTGELIIAGIAIGRGYFNRPDLTASKYIPHPFDPESPYKAYRTGDLVQELPDGSIAFVGRVDHQVKIRGVRIELGEIEHKMESIAGIHRAVVLAQDHMGQKVLVAYYSGETKLDLRQALLLSLPDYMIPSIFVHLAALPLNANGKVDRTALPKPTVSAREEDRFQPRDAEDEAIAEIWSSLLPGPLNLRASFFELGGNSLLAISLVRRINESLQIKLHAQDLFEHPLLEQFVARVRTAVKDSKPG